MTDHSLIKTTILLLVSDPVVRSVLGDIGARRIYGPRYWRPGAGGGPAEGVHAGSVDNPYLCSELAGHDAAMYLRTKCLKMRVLILGGLLDDERLQNREALQGFEVFPKPYTAAELLQKVKDVLSKPRG